MSATDLIELTEYDSFVVAHLEGEIDVSNATAIETELTAALPNSSRGLIIDLTEVSFIDSTGIRFLFDLATRLGHRQQSLRLVVHEGSNLSRTLALVQMPEVVPMFEEVGAAASDEARPSGV